MSNESILVVTTAAVTILSLFLNSFFTNRKLVQLREQDRLDRESEAKIRKADKEEILSAGNERKNEIVKETRQTRTVALKAALKSEEAIVAANNITAKSTVAVEIATKALEKVSGEPKPQLGETAENPIHTITP